MHHFCDDYFPISDPCLQLTFELAWTLLSHRRYEETAKQFLDITKLNSWFPIFFFFAHRRTDLSIAQESRDILLHCSWCADSYTIQKILFTIALLGCYFSLKDYDRTQKLLDKIPGQLDKRKLSGRDMPTEAFIKKKRSSPSTNSFHIEWTSHCNSGFLQEKAGSPWRR
jgi:hypothetical protein